MIVVVATAKVQIFKQITTVRDSDCERVMLLLLPQRYKFSSKSQHRQIKRILWQVVVATAKVQIFKQITTAAPRWCWTDCCCCYRKGTNFQANHNGMWSLCLLTGLLLLPQRYKFSSKSQLCQGTSSGDEGCCCYRKGTNFQANHNNRPFPPPLQQVVVATAKVQIFKQITTPCLYVTVPLSCCCYRKGTNFQANHNDSLEVKPRAAVVVATAKVQIFKQITTRTDTLHDTVTLLLLPQRYKFSSKSQHAAY